MKLKENFLTKKLTVCWLALVCCFLWGSAAPCIKTGYRLFSILEGDAGAQMLFAGVRFVIAGILAVIIGSVASKKVLMPSKKTLPSVFVLALVQTVIQYYFFYVALAHTTGVRASIVQGANAFIALFVAALIFKMERITMKKLIGSLVGFVGVVIINLAGNSFGSGFSVMGEGFMFLSMIAYAFSSVLIRRFSQKEHPFTLSGYQFFLGGLVLIVIAYLMGGRLVVTGSGILMLLYLAFVSAAAYSLWGLLLKYNSVASVTVYSFATPVFGTVLSAIILGESQQAVSWQSFVALVLISIGIVVVNRSKE